ncbi:MAG: hypothetical protein ACRDZP_08250 [Acidimicrobiales bacterium]
MHVCWDVGLALAQHFHGVPLLVEAAVMLPATFAFWLMWRDRTPVASTAAG